jgi:hypothetical protein
LASKKSSHLLLTLALRTAQCTEVPLPQRQRAAQSSPLAEQRASEGREQRVSESQSSELRAQSSESTQSSEAREAERARGRGWGSQILCTIGSNEMGNVRDWTAVLSADACNLDCNVDAMCHVLYAPLLAIIADRVAL